MIKKLLSIFRRKPADQAIIDKVRGHCASLMLERHEEVILAPYPGLYGPIHLWGAANALFRFQAYDKTRKEFMNTLASVSPAGIRYTTTTADEGYLNNPDGTPIKIDKEAQAAFEGFLSAIADYFPMTPEHKMRRTLNGLPGQTQPVQVPNSTIDGYQGAPSEVSGSQAPDDGRPSSEHRDHPPVNGSTDPV